MDWLIVVDGSRNSGYGSFFERWQGGRYKGLEMEGVLYPLPITRVWNDLLEMMQCLV